MELNNILFILFGVFLFWFGWFGFNGGSSLAVNEIGVNVFVVINVAAVFAVVFWMIISWFYKKLSVIGIVIGVVVGFVVIIFVLGYVNFFLVIVIGVVVFIILFYCIRLRERLEFDEILDVWVCYGMGGIWGVFVIGIFVSKVVNLVGNDGFLFGNYKLFFV